MQITETTDYPTTTLPARADALMERLIANGMSAITVDDYETIWQALEAAREVPKVLDAVALVRKELGLSAQR